METGKAYDYDSKYTGDMRRMANQRAGLLQPYLALWKPGIILELGCGIGALASAVQTLTGAEVHGVDASPSGVKAAKSAGIKALVTDLNTPLPFKDNTFDLVYSDQLVEHIFRTDFLFSEAYRILKPGGRLVTITPNLTFWFNRFLFFFGIYPMFLEVSERKKTYGGGLFARMMNDTEAMGHIRVFTPSALAGMLKDAGFSVENVRGLPLSWKLPAIVKIPYDILDRGFAVFPGYARDIFIIAKK